MTKLFISFTTESGNKSGSVSFSDKLYGDTFGTFSISINKRRGALFGCYEWEDETIVEHNDILRIVASRLEKAESFEYDGETVDQNEWKRKFDSFMAGVMQIRENRAVYIQGGFFSNDKVERAVEALNRIFVLENTADVSLDLRTDILNTVRENPSHSDNIQRAIYNLLFAFGHQEASVSSREQERIIRGILSYPEFANKIEIAIINKFYMSGRRLNEEGVTQVLAKFIDSRDDNSLTAGRRD